MGEVKAKLDKRTKWSYTIGATGRDMAYVLISMFLLTYIQYTMELTTAQFGVISIIIVLCLVWDAINDPLMGIIIENCHFKLGKFKPWILIGMLCNVIVIIMLFSVRPEGWGFVIFFGITYVLWGMTYTMNDIAYWGMLPSLTSDPKERNTLVTLMSIFICVGQFTVAGLLPSLVAGNAVMAYRIAAIVIAGCFFAFQLLTFFGVKERPRQDDKEKQLSLKDMFKIFKRNDQLIVIGISNLLYNVGSGLLFAFGMNFFYFEFGYGEGGGLIFIFTVMYGLGTLLAEVAFPLLSAKLTRRKIMTIMTGIIFCGYTLLLLFGYVIPRNVIFLNVTGFVIFFAQSVYVMLMIVMINNTIEYDEYKNHERHDSIISTVRSFTTKLGSAITQGIITMTLIVSGIYGISQKISNLEVATGKGEITSEQVLSKAEGFIAEATTTQTFILRLGMVIFPVLLIGLCYFIVRKKYIIDEKKYDELVAEIKKRNE